jgi:hypothetical protein
MTPPSRPKKAAEPQAVPAAPTEAAKPEVPTEPPAVTAAAPTPPVKEPAKPAEPAARPQESQQRAVRIIGGVTPISQQPQVRDPLDLPKPDVPPPVTID